MKRYSDVYPAKRGKDFGYRYDYAREALEMVSKFDCYVGNGGRRFYLQFIDWVVVAAVGLPLRDWEANPDYWLGCFSAGEAALAAAS